jgi:hypothetical protein
MKPIWQSKTFWFNIVMAVVTMSDHASAFGAVMPAEVGEALPYVVMVGNLILRVLTVGPVEVLAKAASK